MATKQDERRRIVLRTIASAYAGLLIFVIAKFSKSFETVEQLGAVFGLLTPIYFTLRGVVELTTSKENRINIIRNKTKDTLNDELGSYSSSLTPNFQLLPSTDTHSDLVRVFNDHKRRLLILGDAGSGKSFVMFNLACDLIVCKAEDEGKEYIPLYLSLKPWQSKSTDPEDFLVWMSHQICDRYQIPEAELEQVQSIIRENTSKVLLLMDGFDECDMDLQPHLINSLNSFLSTDPYSACKLIITSRNNEYDFAVERNEDTPLQAGKVASVKLLPLTLDQKQAYLREAVDNTNELIQLISQDSALDTFTSTPLVVSLLKEIPQLSFSNYDPQTNNTPTQYVVERFVTAQMENVEKEGNVEAKNFLYEMAFMARKLYEDKTRSDTFQLSYIQPKTWLSINGARMHWLMCQFIATIFVALPGTIAIYLLLNQNINAANLWLNSFIAAFGFAWMTVSGRDHTIPQGLRTGLVLMGFIMIIQLISLSEVSQIVTILISLAFIVCILGVVMIAWRLDFGHAGKRLQSTIEQKIDRQIDPVEQLEINLDLLNDITQNKYLKQFLVFPLLCVVLFFAIFVSFVVDSLFGISNSVALLAPLILGLVVASAIQGNRSTFEEQDLLIPNYGIVTSTRVAFVNILLFAFMVGVPSAYLFGSDASLMERIVFGSMLGCYVGFAQAILWGGFAAIQHLILRLMLLRNISFNMKNELNLAARLNLMRRVGGGTYRYSHKLIQDYLRTHHIINEKR